ncbi:zinc finger protein 594-like [Folsomia candida]|uniref:zinc finger protein 594-like n=1 Tax=Folsomia candida TaxID=158441 RepID=UPI0016053331|nr:zinc finger protein 594-like [Folsomia candida]XP_035705746.1 zinc finger protein 594-like [Folsomia candida]
MYSCLFSYARYSNASSGHYFSSLHQMKNSAPTVDIISDNRDEEPVAPSSAVGTFDSDAQQLSDKQQKPMITDPSESQECSDEHKPSSSRLSRHRSRNVPKNDRSRDRAPSRTIEEIKSTEDGESILAHIEERIQQAHREFVARKNRKRKLKSSYDQLKTSYLKNKENTSNIQTGVPQTGPTRTRKYSVPIASAEDILKVKNERPTENKKERKPCICRNCNDPNDTRGNKKRKIAEHPCPECSKSFKCPADLSRHMLVHSGQRPYTCGYPDCGRSFKRRSHLSHHERRHEGIVPPSHVSIGSVTPVGTMILAPDAKGHVVRRPLTEQDKKDDDLFRVFFVPAKYEGDYVAKSIHFTKYARLNRAASQVKSNTTRDKSLVNLKSKTACTPRHAVDNGVELDTDNAVAFSVIFKTFKLVDWAKAYHRLRLDSLGNRSNLDAISLFRPWIEYLEEAIKQQVHLLDVTAAAMVRTGIFPDAFKEEGQVQATRTTSLYSIVHGPVYN